MNKGGGKYAKNVANPMNYSFIFVIAMVAGALLSSRLGGPRPTALDRSAPEVWRQRFGENPTLRYITVSLPDGLCFLAPAWPAAAPAGI